jgi:hypothetical protein
MTLLDQYREHALEAERKAAWATRAGDRESHLMMARAWRELERTAAQGKRRAKGLPTSSGGAACK